MTSAPVSESAPRRPRLRWLRRLILFLLYLSIFAVTAFAGLVSATLRQLPALERSAQKQDAIGVIYARDGRTVLRRLSSPTSRRYASGTQVPPVLAHAVVAAEDHRFYSEHGVDPRGIARAALFDARHGDFAEGGSTLTQQLVKNAYVGSQRKLTRKAREALLAVVLDADWSKQRILTAYLNNAYFGNGAYGVVDAAQRYYGVTLDHLTLAQSALLAGLLRDPSQNPVSEPRLTAVRRNEVLTQMGQLGYATTAQVTTAIATPVAHSEGPNEANELAPHFDDAVVGQLIARFGAARTLSGGLRVTTTLDARLQLRAHDAVQAVEASGLSAALVAVDPRDGQVRALALGGPAAKNAFDVATDGLRQPGSAFKPFTLAAAYEAGLTPTSPVLSAPFDEIWEGKRVKIGESSGLYAGPTTIQAGTWNSDNTVYARLAKQVGIPSVVSNAVAAGIVSPLDDLPSLAIGGLTRGVSPLEMASAYATFDDHGIRRTGADGLPLFVTAVADHHRHTIVTMGTRARHSFDPAVADLVTQTLEGVITKGTGTAAAIGRPAAGKTGTTERNVDAWFVGYTPDLVTAVWVGHPEGSIPMQTQFHGQPVQGGTFPAQIWAAFMQATPDAGDFTLHPPKYVSVLVDSANGLLTDLWCSRAVTRSALAGHAPTDHSGDCPPRMRDAPDVRGLTRDGATALLTRDGFTATIDDEPVADDTQVGTVVDQVPDPGTKIRQTDSIQLLIGS